MENILHRILQPSETVILEMGCDGGSLRLLGIPSGISWKFQLETIVMVDDDEPWAVTEYPWVATWRGALKHLEQNTWQRLYPFTAHPEFRQKLFAALKVRQKKGIPINWMVWGDVLDIETRKLSENEHTGAN